MAAKKRPARKKRASAAPRRVHGQGRQWSDREKLAVLQVLAERGGSHIEVQRATGVPESTIRAWLGTDRWAKEYARIREAYRARMADELEAAATIYAVVGRKIGGRAASVLDGDEPVKGVGMELGGLGRAARDFVEAAMRLHEMGLDGVESAAPRVVRVYRGRPAPRAVESEAESEADVG